MQEGPSPISANFPTGPSKKRPRISVGSVKQPCRLPDKVYTCLTPPLMPLSLPSFSHLHHFSSLFGGLSFCRNGVCLPNVKRNRHKARTNEDFLAIFGEHEFLFLLVVVWHVIFWLSCLYWPEVNGMLPTSGIICAGIAVGFSKYNWGKASLGHGMRNSE